MQKLQGKKIKLDMEREAPRGTAIVRVQYDQAYMPLHPAFWYINEPIEAGIQRKKCATRVVWRNEIDQIKRLTETATPLIAVQQSSYAPAREAFPENCIIEFDLSTFVHQLDAGMIAPNAPGIQNYGERTPFYRVIEEAKTMKESVLIINGIDRAHHAVICALGEALLSGKVEVGGSKYPPLSLKGLLIVLIISADIGDEVDSQKLKEIISKKRRNDGTPLIPPRLLEKAEIEGFYCPRAADIVSSAGMKLADQHVSSKEGCYADVPAFCFSPKIVQSVFWDVFVEAEKNGTVLPSTLPPFYELFAKKTLTEKFGVTPVNLNWKENHEFRFVADSNPGGAFLLRDIDSEPSPIVVPMPLGILANLGIRMSKDVYINDCGGVDAILQKAEEFYVGQKEILSLVGNAIKASAQSDREEGCLFTGLFLGRSGSGKTALPKAIAKATGLPFYLIECNRFSNDSDAESAIFARTDSLIEFVENNPGGIIILDEVDKAPPSFWKVIMTALQDGELKSSSRSVLLRYSMIFATGNYLTDAVDSLENTEDDGSIRQALINENAIDEAYLERFGLVAIVRQLEGDAAIPLWLNELRNVHEFNKCIIPDEVGMYLERQHLIKGGSGGARARHRTLSRAIQQKEIIARDGVVTVAAKIPPWKTRRSAQWLAHFSGASERIASSYFGNEWQVCEILRSIKIQGLKVNPDKPIGVFLLAGPTGCGKTFLAKILADIFDKGDLVNFSATQCTQESEISPYLFGTSAGHKGTELGGVLTTPFRQRSDRVVVIDEFDRGHSSLINFLMPVLDSGFIMDPQKKGMRGLDLRNGLFFLTTNLEADLMAELAILGETNPEEAMNRARAALVGKNELKPEHLERITAVLPMAMPRSDSNSISSTVAQLAQAQAAQFEINDSSVIEAAASYANKWLLANPSLNNARAILRRLDDFYGEHQLNR